MGGSGRWPWARRGPSPLSRAGQQHRGRPTDPRGRRHRPLTLAAHPPPFWPHQGPEADSPAASSAATHPPPGRTKAQKPTLLRPVQRRPTPPPGRTKAQKPTLLRPVQRPPTPLLAAPRPRSRLSCGQFSGHPPPSWPHQGPEADSPAASSAETHLFLAAPRPRSRLSCGQFSGHPPPFWPHQGPEADSPAASSAVVDRRPSRRRRRRRRGWSVGPGPGPRHRRRCGGRTPRPERRRRSGGRSRWPNGAGPPGPPRWW